MFVRPVLASRRRGTKRAVVTLHARYPRIIHGEVMTHRVFSRNARSSRAVPVNTMLEEVRNTPFVPWHWGKNQRGMQAGESFTPLEVEEMRYEWLGARNDAVVRADNLRERGLHKQIPNRLLEPFSWIDTLITSTSWANFLRLRDHSAAEPHFQDLAGLFKQALMNLEWQDLEPGEWHLPYITADDWAEAYAYLGAGGRRATEPEAVELLKKISAARCARISYKPFDGDGSFERELQRFDHLLTDEPPHASPVEHQATPHEDWFSLQLAGNLGPGWIQFRKTIPGEAAWDEESWQVAA